ncbi:MAG: hypothetical protein FWE98_07165 [Oscillospiraceae bacterium]|nr:hypothetical protein [Oscillospiraceae bacterium]
MKTTKRLLSILLAVLLGLGLLAPGAGATAIDPNTPVITMQPKSYVLMTNGRTLTLEVAAVLPEGSNGSLSYAWYEGWEPEEDADPIATGAKLVIPMKRELLYPGDEFGYDFYFSVVVTNTYIGTEGVEQTASTESEYSFVNVLFTTKDVLSNFWRMLRSDMDSGGLMAALMFSIFLPLNLLYSSMYVLTYLLLWVENLPAILRS